jgi:hypothetical protein
MNGSQVSSRFQESRRVNAVALQTAVLCAECDVVSDSPHALVCGSRSLFNIAHILGGNLPEERASVITSEVVEMAPREIVLAFPAPHRIRNKATI